MNKEIIKMLQKMKHIFMMLLFLMFSKGAYSQVSVRGNIIDENDKEVIGCSVRILSTDSTFLSGGVTNDVGEFPHKSNGGECNRLITNKKQNI